MAQPLPLSPGIPPRTPLPIPPLPHAGSETRLECRLHPRGSWEIGGFGEGRAPSTPDLRQPLSQLVAGIKYYLTLEMGSTACRKNAVAGDRIDLATCPLAVGAQQEVTALPKGQVGLVSQQPAPSGCPG